jgi:hypothetical protein
MMIGSEALREERVVSANRGAAFNVIFSAVAHLVKMVLTSKH